MQRYSALLSSTTKGYHLTSFVYLEMMDKINSVHEENHVFYARLEDYNTLPEIEGTVQSDECKLHLVQVTESTMQ